MAAKPMDAHAPPTQQPTESSFPQELPPRRLTQTWMQRNGFKTKTFFKLHYRSFSLRNRHGAREVWRRICMWLIMLGRLAQLGIEFAFWSSELYNNSYTMAGYIILVVLAAALLMANCWTLALIGDAAGTRRALGLTVRRKALDAFLFFMAPVELILAGTCVLWIWTAGALSAVWVCLWLVYLGVSLMASGEPVDQYGMGG